MKLSYTNFNVSGNNDCAAGWRISQQKENIREPLDSDLEMCRSRLTSLYSKLKLKPDLLQQYNDIFKEQLDCKSREYPPKKRNGKGFIYVILGVIRSDRETTKLGIVFD